MKTVKRTLNWDSVPTVDEIVDGIDIRKQLVREVLADPRVQRALRDKVESEKEPEIDWTRPPWSPGDKDSEILEKIKKQAGRELSIPERLSRLRDRVDELEYIIEAGVDSKRLALSYGDQQTIQGLFETARADIAELEQEADGLISKATFPVKRRLPPVRESYRNAPSPYKTYDWTPPGNMEQQQMAADRIKRDREDALINQLGELGLNQEERRNFFAAIGTPPAPGGSREADPDDLANRKKRVGRQ